MRAKIGEIWKVVSPILIEINGRYYYDTEVRPYLIIDDGRGLLVEANNDYLCTKITGSEENSKSKLIENWQELGLTQKSHIRIEIPIRIEEEQLIQKMTEIDADQLAEYYKDVLEIFNIEAIKKLTLAEMQETGAK
jgi:hypothetical protein